MKKRVLAISLLLVAAIASAFLMIRNNRIIQQQGAEVDRLDRSVADLQAQLGELQKGSRALPVFQSTIQSRSDAGNRTLEAMPNGTVMPFSQKPQEVPPGWVPFEFNGMTYYRTPLALAR